VSDFLWRTPPFCPTPACYMHGVPERDHHVEGCPMYDTVASAMHRFSDATDAAIAAMRPELEAVIEGTLSRLERWRLRWATRRWR
jgi:hypothetical protein